MTTGPGDEKAAGGPDVGRFRASHDDREQVIAALRVAFIQGRLTRDEFDLRVGRALGARTYAELAALTGDLPAGLTGPPAHSVPQADIRPGGRRARRIAGILAAVAVLAAALSVASLGHRSAAVPGRAPAGAVMYVGTPHGLIPVETGTNTPGKPVWLGARPVAIAFTPSGKTAYILDNRRSVIPLATATNTPGKPIGLAGNPLAIAITPDGKTAYVVSGCGCAPVVTPVATATNTPGKPIKIGGMPWAIAITPDGKTAYVLDDFSAVLPVDNSGKVTQAPARIVPVATATNTPGKPIKIGHNTEVIAIAP